MLSAPAATPVVASMHFGNNLVIDIAGIAAGDLGCQCREHKVCCGKVVSVDIVVHLHREKILVSEIFSGKDKMKEKIAIPVDK